MKRRGRDLNPRPAERRVTVFETAAFDRSATPPVARQGTGAQDERLPGRGSGEGGIRTLEAGISPPNALAGRRLQPLGHFSGRIDGNDYWPELRNATRSAT